MEGKEGRVGRLVAGLDAPLSASSQAPAATATVMSRLEFGAFRLEASGRLLVAIAIVLAHPQLSLLVAISGRQAAASCNRFPASRTTPAAVSRRGGWQAAAVSGLRGSVMAAVLCKPASSSSSGLQWPGEWARQAYACPPDHRRLLPAQLKGGCSPAGQTSTQPAHGFNDRTTSSNSTRCAPWPRRAA